MTCEYSGFYRKPSLTVVFPLSYRIIHNNNRLSYSYEKKKLQVFFIFDNIILIKDHYGYSYTIKRVVSLHFFHFIFKLYRIIDIYR